MKKFALVSLLAAGSLSPLFAQQKTFKVADDFVKLSNPLKLKNFLEQKKLEGGTLDVSDATRALIKEKLKGLAPDAWVDQLSAEGSLPTAQQMPGTTSVSAGTGSGGSGGGAGSGAAVSGEQPATPQGAPKGATTPSVPTVAGTSDTTVPEKPLVISAKKPADSDLTGDQLNQLSASEKKASDDAVVAAVVQLARKPLSDKYKNDFTSSLQEVLKASAFKNKAALRGALAQDGAVEKYIADLKQAQLSGELYDDLADPAKSNYVAKLAQLIQAFLIDQQAQRMTDMRLNLFDILLNLALSQRPVITKPAEGAQIISDSQATNAIDGVVALIKAEPGFAQFLKDAAQAANKKLEKGQKEEAVNAALNQDFLKRFLAELRRLLVHPKFLKFADKDGKLAGKGTVLAPDGLLVSLTSEDPNSFNIRRVRGALVDQAYFEPTRLEDYMKENDNENAVKALLSDHANRLRATTYPVAEFLTKELAAAKAVRDLKGKFQAALSRATFKNDQDRKQLSDMIANLDGTPDPVLIGKGLQALGVELSLISNIKKMIASESKKFDVQAKVKDILMQAKEQVAKGKVDAFLNRQLKPLLNAYQVGALSGAERTVDSAYSVLIALMGKVALDKIVTAKDFYNWVYEYGLLMLLFKNLQTEAKVMKTQDVLDRLRDTLDAMNTGVVKSNMTYFSVVTDPRYRPIIDAGLYKGKLTAIIDAMKKYDLMGLKNALAKFVSDAQIGVESSADYNSLVGAALDGLKKVMIDEIARQLQVLNSGSGGYQVIGLELTGKDAGRNALVYDALKSVFAGQEKAVRAGIDKLDLDAFKKEVPGTMKAIQDRLDVTKERDLQKLDAGQKKAIIALLQTYLENMVDKLSQLKKLNAQAEAPAESTTTGAPEAPMAPGAPEAPSAPGAPEAPMAPPM